MGSEFLKGYAGKKRRGVEMATGYSQGGDSRGLAQACEQEMCLRSVGQRC
jgi:hypothetical protein